MNLALRFIFSLLFLFVFVSCGQNAFINADEDEKVKRVDRLNPGEEEPGGEDYRSVSDSMT